VLEVHYLRIECVEAGVSLLIQVTPTHSIEAADEEGARVLKVQLQPHHSVCTVIFKSNNKVKEVCADEKSQSSLTTPPLL
jgi:hypothetical protein